MSFDFSKNLPAIWLALTIALALVVHTYFFELKWQVSLIGFSALEVLESIHSPENFRQDYPGGSRITTLASILTFVYKPLQVITGLSGLNLMMLMIAFEIVCVALGSFLLWRVLIKGQDYKCDVNPLFKWGYVWLVIILLLSGVTSPNWANFSFPYFHGQFYGFADAFRLAAIAFTFTRQWKWAALFLVAGFMIHPIKMLVACFFILGVVFCDWRHSLNKISIAWGSVASACFGLWAYFWLGLGQGFEGNYISVDDFVAYSRIFQVHWYPFDHGLFTFNHDRVLTPFMGLMLMTMLALSQNQWSQHRINQCLLGLAALMIVCFVGLWVSFDQSSITLIRACLLRASTLVTLLAPMIILSAVLVKWKEGQWQWIAIYAVFFISGFEIIKYVNMSPVLALMAVALNAWEQKSVRWWVSLSAAVVTIAIGWLWFNYPDVQNPLIGASISLPFVLIAWGLLSVVAKVPNWMRFGLVVPDARLVSLTLVLFVSGGLWGLKNKHMSHEHKNKARAFQEVQIWAKESTAQDALFMVDPCQKYGWRDFSARSSIGTPYEWYMTGWAYSVDQEVLARGEAIGKALGLDMVKHLTQPGKKLISRSVDVCLDAQNHFYDPDRQGIRNVAKEFGTDYFVMLKSKSNAINNAASTQPVKQNEFFIVYKAEDILK